MDRNYDIFKQLCRADEYENYYYVGDTAEAGYAYRKS